MVNNSMFRPIIAKRQHQRCHVTATTAVGQVVKTASPVVKTSAVQSPFSADRSSLGRPRRRLRATFKHSIFGAFSSRPFSSLRRVRRRPSRAAPPVHTGHALGGFGRPWEALATARGRGGGSGLTSAALGCFGCVDGNARRRWRGPPRDGSTARRGVGWS